MTFAPSPEEMRDLELASLKKFGVERELLLNVAHAAEALLEANWLCLHKEDLDMRTCIGCEMKLAFKALLDHSCR